MRVQDTGSIYWHNKILEAEAPLRAENAKLREVNAELLDLIKRQREGFETLVDEIAWDDMADALITKAEGGFPELR